jgi:hypothetical protein
MGHGRWGHSDAASRFACFVRGNRGGGCGGYGRHVEGHREADDRDEGHHREDQHRPAGAAQDLGGSAGLSPQNGRGTE